MVRDFTVHVVNGDPAARETLRALIESVGLNVETYSTAEQLLDAYAAAWTGCVVTDVRLEGASGLDLHAELNARGAHLPVILVAAHAEVATAVRAMKSGAFDFFERPFSDQVLLDRIQQALVVAARGEQIRKQRAASVLRRLRLTAREQRVMELLVQGRTSKQISAELGLAARTVELHRARVMEKMEVDNIAALIRTVTRSLQH